ncbi:MAG: hypothetical protein IKW19_00455 [Akkermansia sp.]|nr:hypothetical protein [Akkermansia sp.]
MAYSILYRAYIDIIDSGGNTYRYPLPEDGSVLLIGSAEDCSISLPHVADLLPQHCTISLQEQGYVLSAATEGAALLAENEPTAAAVLVPGAVYNLGSTILMYAVEEAPAEAPAEEAPAEEPEAEEETPKKKKKKFKKLPGITPIRDTVFYTEEEGALHIILRRLYVIAILAASFLAGLTLRYWMITGEFLIDELLK